ncbi:MAG: permease [candidate division Zixibacteria bacterium]|nr:permease [candidate division Zixibacteria bacterium]
MMIIDFLYKAGLEFFGLTILVLPYFLIGAVTGAILEVYLKPATAIKYFGKGIRSIINASLLGAILPGCSCATMPMASSLKSSGARLGTVGAFIMVSPLLSPHTLVLNYGLLGWEFTIARIIASLAGAILLGLIFNILENSNVRGFSNQPQLLPNIKDCCNTVKGCGCSPAQKDGFWQALINIIKNLGKYFLLGIAVASILMTLVPESLIPKYIGTSGIYAYASAVLFGIPFYVCEGEEIPITLALLKLGLGPGPSFSFLLGAVGTCIPTMIMAQKIIGKRPTLLYIIIWILFAIVSGVAFQLYMGS